MMLSIALSITTIVLLIAAVVVCTAMRRDVRRLQAASREENAKAAVAAAELGQRMRDLETSTGLLVAPSLPISGMNLTKRSHALRLHRLGKAADSIGIALSVPRAEVELLLKVHAIVMQKVEA